MQTFTTIEVVVGANGVARIYGDGGMVFEAQGQYLRLEGQIDPKLSPPSGEVKQKAEK